MPPLPSGSQHSATASCLPGRGHRHLGEAAGTRSPPGVALGVLAVDDGLDAGAFTTFGFGRKKASCESTSASNDWCDSAFLAFMMRTIAASIATVRSSSTRFGLCDSSSDAIGTLIFRIGHENFVFTANESVKATRDDMGVLAGPCTCHTLSYVKGVSGARLAAPLSQLPGHRSRSGKHRPRD